VTEHMSDRLRQYCEYISNAGGSVLISYFDEDFEPIGPKVRTDLVRAGLASQPADKIYLTLSGWRAARD
jgi:hypothetical protein